MIKVICVGKLKEKYFKDACLEYERRIRKYHSIEIIELKDSNMIKEKDEIQKYISPKDYIITLEIEGNQMNSLEFSKKIETLFLTKPNITFIIGGSNGLHEDIKKQSDFPLSFSKLTFPHTLFRLILLEQIYRAFKIQANETYHK